MNDSVNPQLPAGYDLIWSAIVVVYVAAIIAMCWKVMATASLSRNAKLLWIVAVVLAPVVGIIAWFASAGWRHRSELRHM